MPKIHVMLPECFKIPSSIDSLLDSQLVYLARQVPLQTLLNVDFKDGFIKGGSVLLMSYGTAIDSDDCIALLPTGKLVLNVFKDTYQKFGINGQPSKVDKKTGKYVVQVDILSDKFCPGVNLYNHVTRCLAQLPFFDLLVTWKPNDEMVCPSSIQNYFLKHDIQCSRVKMSKTLHQFTGMKVPMIDSQILCPSNDQESCGYEEMFEWLGACTVGMDMYEGDRYVSTYTCPCPNREVKCCVGCQYQGLIHPEIVQQTVDILRKYMKERNLPWCSVSVHGFMDIPLSWKYDHGFRRNGDNLFTLLMFKNGDYWMYSGIGDSNICS